MKKVITLIALLALAGCSDPNSTSHALQAAGYHNIQTNGYRFFGCDRNDAWHTGFTAVGPTGIPVSGVVCRGWLKGNTIRLD